VMVGLMLSACGAPVSRPIPLAQGPVGFERDGVAYVAEGQGDALAVTRAEVAFGNYEGLAAKRAGEAFCAGQGGRLNPQAYGHFVAGAWLFKGGCV
jgi:hypothetical protein